jgi:hypothetical protein
VTPPSSLIFFTRLRGKRGDMESDLVLEEGKYKGVYSEFLCVLC